MYLIKEMPKLERPRERLIKDGVKSLSNVELLAILLRTGSKDKSVIQLAQSVIYHLESIKDLKNISVQELMKIPGIKTAKATTVLAAIELGSRIYQQKHQQNIQIKSSHDVYRLMEDLQFLKQETFYCIYLDTKLQVIAKDKIYQGTIDQIIVHPREVFNKAIKLSSSYIIIVHNHPSGDATPSKADIQTTKNLEKAGNIIDITILDHIIIGKNEFYSYKEQQKFYL